MNVKRFLNLDNLTRVCVLAILVILAYDHLSPPQEVVNSQPVRYQSPVVSSQPTDLTHERVLRFILQHEGPGEQQEVGHGGYSYRGITQESWHEWRIQQGDRQHLPRAVKDASDSLVMRFYYDYFESYHVWDLNPALQLIYADFAVLSGHRATKDIQSLVGVSRDGVWGTATSKAVQKFNATLTTHQARRDAFNQLDEMKRKFLAWLGKHPSHRKDVKGWLQRSDELRDYMQPYL